MQSARSRTPDRLRADLPYRLDVKGARTLTDSPRSVEEKRAGRRTMATIQVDPKACIRCGGCVDVCFSAHVFELDAEASRAVHPERCWACGECVAVCPTDAIDHELFPLEETPIIEPESLPTKESLISAFRYRRSVRTYQGQPVPRDLVRELVSIGRWAPTAHNNQGIDWIAFDDRTRILELARQTVAGLQRFTRFATHPISRPWLRIAIGRENARRLRRLEPLVNRMDAKLGQGDDPVFYQAPTILIGHTQQGNQFGRDDAVYAMYNIMLAAQRFDLGTCQIGFFQAIVSRSAKLRRDVGIPEGRVPQVCLTLGYPLYTSRRAPERRKPDLSWNPR